MRIAIIGAGNVGKALGAGWRRAGHEIVFGVRDPAANTSEGYSVLDVASAAHTGEVIVLAVPWPAVPDALAACGDLSGRVLIDATNPVGFGADGLGLILGHSTSGGEEVAKLAQGALVYKTLNQIGFKEMADPSGFPAAPVMFVAGDDAAHKPLVMRLVAELGFAAADAGPLRRARLLEPLAMLWMNQVLKQGAAEASAFLFVTKETL